jgi:hypothetical protein
LWRFNTVQSAPFLCYFLFLRPKYRHHHILKGPQPMFIPEWERPSFTPIQDYVSFSLAARSKAWVFRPLDCWECGFETRRWHRYLSFVSVVCCELEVSATDRFLFQRSPIEFVCVVECATISGATISFCTYNK